MASMFSYEGNITQVKSVRQIYSASTNITSVKLKIHRKKKNFKPLVKKKKKILKKKKNQF